MDIKAWSSLIGTIVWPLIVIIVLFYYREDVKKLIQAINKRIEEGGFTIKAGGKTVTVERLGEIVKDTVKEETIPELWCNLGELYRYQGKLWDAELMYKGALKKDENFIRAYWGLGATYRDKSKQSDTDESRENYLMEALAYCNKAIEKGKRYAAAYLLRATIYLLQMKGESVIEAELRKAIDYWPKKADERPNMKDFILEEEDFKKVRDRKWFKELTKQ